MLHQVVVKVFKKQSINISAVHERNNKYFSDLSYAQVQYKMKKNILHCLN
jgi:hypothetical protein